MISRARLLHPQGIQRRSCGFSPRTSDNAADAVRSLARQGKKIEKIKKAQLQNQYFKTFSIFL